MDRFQIVLEVALSALLLITIFYSLYLGRALSVIRRNRGELDALIASLHSSSQQAQAGIDHLRQTTEMVGRSLGKTVERGKSLKHELTILCERSEAVAQILEKTASIGRPANTATVREAEAPDMDSPRFSARVRADEGRWPAASTLKTPSGKTAAERELLRALRQKQV